MERLQQNNDTLQQSIKQIKDNSRNLEKEKDVLVKNHLDELRNVANNMRNVGSMFTDEEMSAQKVGATVHENLEIFKIQGARNQI